MRSSSVSIVYFASSSSILILGPAPLEELDTAVVVLDFLTRVVAAFALGHKPPLRSQDSHRGLTGWHIV